MNYELAQLLGGRWVMQPADFRGMVLPMIKRAEAASPAAIQAAMEAYAARDTGPTLVGDVAVIRVTGPIVYKSSWFSMYFGAAAIEDLQFQHRAALADPAVRTIVYRFDSPGGEVTMVPEFADELFASRGQKPIIAIADTLVASAGYWLASQCDTIYATTSSRLGSIGVYCEHDDISGMLEKAGVKITLISHGDHKVDGNPYEPLSDSARADAQASVDEIGDWFDGAVARGRGVKKSVVLETFGQGKVFKGKKAIEIGLADKQGTFGQVMARLTKGRAGAGVALADVGGVAPPVADSVAATKAAKASVCSACGKASCPCEEETCPEDCPTCDPGCPCREADEGGKASARAAAAADEEAIIAALQEN